MQKGRYEFKYECVPAFLLVTFSMPLYALQLMSRLLQVEQNYAEND